MHEAALRAGGDPDRLSFLHAVRVVRRKLPLFAAPSPRARPALHEAVLAEILVVRGRQNVPFDWVRSASVGRHRRRERGYGLSAPHH